MKPIAILRFSADDGPGYFASFLDARRVPWTLFCLDAGNAPPANLDEFSGLVLMGGPMSANDPLPWIPGVLELIREAVRKSTPVLGHCLGGQLMSKAMGGEVTVNPVKEIGWQRVSADDDDAAREWLAGSLGAADSALVFQWHGDTFSLPPGATRLLTGTACANQAFVVGNSLGMQCHVEMTPAMIEEWCGEWALENVPVSASVQSPDAIRADLEARLTAMRRLSDALYSRWLDGVSARAKV